MTHRFSSELSSDDPLLPQPPRLLLPVPPAPAPPPPPAPGSVPYAFPACEYCGCDVYPGEEEEAVNHEFLCWHKEGCFRCYGCHREFNSTRTCYLLRHIALCEKCYPRREFLDGDWRALNEARNFFSRQRRVCFLSPLITRQGSRSHLVTNSPNSGAEFPTRRIDDADASAYHDTDDGVGDDYDYADDNGDDYDDDDDDYDNGSYRDSPPRATGAGLASACCRDEQQMFSFQHNNNENHLNHYDNLRTIEARTTTTTPATTAAAVAAPTVMATAAAAAAPTTIAALAATATKTVLNDDPIRGRLESPASPRNERTQTPTANAEPQSDERSKAISQFKALLSEALAEKFGESAPHTAANRTVEMIQYDCVEVNGRVIDNVSVLAVDEWDDVMVDSGGGGGVRPRPKAVDDNGGATSTTTTAASNNGSSSSSNNNNDVKHEIKPEQQQQQQQQQSDKTSDTVVVVASSSERPQSDDAASCSSPAFNVVRRASSCFNLSHAPNGAEAPDAEPQNDTKCSLDSASADSMSWSECCGAKSPANSEERVQDVDQARGAEDAYCSPSPVPQSSTPIPRTAEDSVGNSRPPSSLTDSRVWEPPEAANATTQTNTSLASDDESAMASFDKRRAIFQKRMKTEEREWCGRCHQQVFRMDRFVCLKTVYHHRCFRCSSCSARLNYQTFCDDGKKPFCKTCYVNRNLLRNKKIPLRRRLNSF